MRIRSLSFAILIALTPCLSACWLIPCVERRHDSGVLLVCPERFRDMPEDLKAAAAFGWQVAEDHPDDLGYPWPDPSTGELEVRIAGPNGEIAIRDRIAGNARRLGPKPTELPAPKVPIRFARADRNFRQLQDIQHRSVPAKDLPDGDAIYQVGPDTRRNATVMTIDRLSDRLIRTLVTRYGSEAIVIHVDPNRPRTGY